MEPGLPPTGAGPVSAPFGTTAAGAQARVHTLVGERGVVVRVSDFGATVVGVHLPDRDGEVADVTLGFDAVEGYESGANAYFGATVGRVANRIAHAEFSLDGRRHRLAANEPPHHLHGGAERSFSKVLWQVIDSGNDLVELAYASPAGEEGYPGRVEAIARYQITGTALEVRYRATTDATTPVNLTTHTYWNLSGAGNGTVLDHQVEVRAQAYTPTDDALIPTGGIEPVAGTPLDLRRPARIGDAVDALVGTPALGYDHNLVLDGPPGTLRLAARVSDPASGRVLELHTDQPGLQLYTGNRLDGQTGKDGRRYIRHGGLCLEPQHHPDAIHHPRFPSILLEPGDGYEHVSLFRFGV